MYRRIIPLTLALLSLSAAAGQTLKLVDGAYEAVLADVTFPSSTAGNLVVKMCATCDAQVLPVDSGTAFVGANGPVPLQDFLEKVAELRQTPNGNQTTAVGVFYNLETNRITRVSLHPH
jgi:hypothetical protein